MLGDESILASHFGEATIELEREWPGRSTFARRDTAERTSVVIDQTDHGAVAQQQQDIVNVRGVLQRRPAVWRCTLHGGRVGAQYGDDLRDATARPVVDLVDRDGAVVEAAGAGVHVAISFDANWYRAHILAALMIWQAATVPVVPALAVPTVAPGG